MKEFQLPWQFVVLGLFAFGAIFAVMLLVFSCMPSMEMARSTQVTVWNVAIPYLAAGLVFSPFSCAGGRRHFNQLNPKDAAGKRQSLPVSRGKRMSVAIITLCAGLVMTVYSYTQTGMASGANHMVGWILCAVGLLGIVGPFLAESLKPDKWEVLFDDRQDAPPIAKPPTPVAERHKNL